MSIDGRYELVPTVVKSVCRASCESQFEFNPSSTTPVPQARVDPTKHVLSLYVSKLRAPRSLSRGATQGNLNRKFRFVAPAGWSQPCSEWEAFQRMNDSFILRLSTT